MAAGTLVVLAYAPGTEPRLGVPTVAGTMALVTFVFFQVFNLLNVRNDRRSVFSRETLENPSAFVATAAVIVLLILMVEMDIAHGFMTHHRPHLRSVAGGPGDRLGSAVGRRARQDRAPGPGRGATRRVAAGSSRAREPTHREVQ
jgi:hypothetical protein